MKKLLLLLVSTLLVVATGAKAQSPQSSWTTYTVQEDVLAVALPKQPDVNEDLEKSDKHRRRRTLSAFADGVQYTIYVIENRGKRQTLQSFIDEQTTSTPKWELESERELNLNGIAGKSFVYPDNKGMVQFFATEDRLYDFRAYGAPIDDARVTRFFSSISLTGQQAGIEVSANTTESSNTGAATERPRKGDEVDRKIQFKSRPAPEYSDEAKRKGVRGVVVLKCIFRSNGTVTDIKVIAGLPYGLTESAIEAAKQIKFVPATKDGHNVSMWMQLEYNFNLY
ncbi:MAG TPA: energy transducer TonB [Pyrinomonadaceae bacterium]